MHGMKHTAPSRARRQVRECIEYPYQPRPERAFPGVVVALSFDRPIDQERPPHNGVAVHEAPEAAVPALIAIIPHRSEEHTSELQSRLHLVCRLLLEKKKKN